MFANFGAIPDTGLRLVLPAIRLTYGDELLRHDRATHGRSGRLSVYR
jgi:hypothetical protein